MLKVKPGTTPTLVIQMPNIDFSEYIDLCIVIKQYPIEIIKKLEDIVIADEYMAVTLTEEETLLLKSRKKCQTEIVFVDKNKNVTKSAVSPIIVLDSDNGGVLYSGKFRYDGSGAGRIIGDNDGMASVLYKTTSGIIVVPYDYNLLRNKPSIEGHELIGDQTFEDIGLSPIPPEDISALPIE